MPVLRSFLVTAALLALGASAAAAQSRAPAPVWSRFPDRDTRWESRDGDSDSDSDSDRRSRGGIFDRDSDSDSDSDRRSRGGIFGRDSDSDSDSDRGGIFDRDRRDREDRRDHYPDSQRVRDILLGRNTARAHEAWHRANDRDRGNRDWQRRHEEFHDQLDRERRQRAGTPDRSRRGDAGRATGRAGGVIR